MQLKNLLVIFTLLGGITWLPAQIIVTNATFPAAGDSLKTATDVTPVGLVMTPAGGPQTWNYSTLTPSTHRVTVFQPAANGTSFAGFPAADLVVIGGGGAETYYDVSASVFANLGISGSGILSGLPIAADLKFVPPLPERHAPLSFFDIYQSSTNASIAEPSSAIPTAILDSLGVPSGLFDSIRLRETISRLDIVDGFGALTIPGGTYDVLREKRTDYSDLRIDIHVPFFGWQDITGLLGVGGFGADTTITYNFISNGAKEPIAVATVDPNTLTVQQIEYKDLGVTSAVAPLSRDVPAVFVTPNPVYNRATFKLKNIMPGNYTLRLFDTNGQSLLVKEITSEQEIVSLESLSGGIYLYNVSNGNNQIVASGKLMKVNP